MALDKFEGDPATSQPLDRLIASSFEILRKAASEIPDHGHWEQKK